MPHMPYMSHVPHVPYMPDGDQPVAEPVPELTFDLAEVLPADSALGTAPPIGTVEPVRAAQVAEAVQALNHGRTTHSAGAATRATGATAATRSVYAARMRTRATGEATGNAKRSRAKAARAKAGAVRLAHRTAMRRVKRAGVKWHSSGGCVDRDVRSCTSLASVRAGTISSVIALRKSSQCPIKITGGTEAGHAPGPFSHGNGYKLDITLNACVDRFITHNYPLYSVRGDGARLYRGPSGDVYARESDHWDILFR
ncbi:hypothetical protein [Spongiactinospora sp. TRM90649]|uniref:hypothetical protein n=1 Tax=Spongiactinospora sp. TRM90649 TaxID=3031114 RepID=UPI0023F8926A|nr:hypothetical protein [Spongiactinospora sp. TRM90649]MDF5756073.1 hypothetical protein [Spongiactinospora sp. TRM90649]